MRCGTREAGAGRQAGRQAGGRARSLPPLSMLLTAAPAAAIDESYRGLRSLGRGMRNARTQLPTWSCIASRIVGRRRLSRQVRRAQTHPEPRRAFSHLAAATELRRMETRNPYRSASHLSPGSPPTLLPSPDGRRYLAQDLLRRTGRRRREAAVHARLGVRVPADLPVLIAKKVEPEVAATGKGEETAVALGPVGGRLLDLSEGGAAPRTALPLAAGELVEFWSTDEGVWLSPLSSGVVDVEEGADGGAQGSGEAVVDVHFLAPPLSDLRRAIADLQRREREALDEELGPEHAPSDTGAPTAA